MLTPPVDITLVTVVTPDLSGRFFNPVSPAFPRNFGFPTVGDDRSNCFKMETLRAVRGSRTNMLGSLDTASGGNPGGTGVWHLRNTSA